MNGLSVSAQGEGHTERIREPCLQSRLLVEMYILRPLFWPLYGGVCSWLLSSVQFKYLLKQSMGLSWIEGRFLNIIQVHGEVWVLRSSKFSVASTMVIVTILSAFPSYRWGYRAQTWYVSYPNPLSKCLAETGLELTLLGLIRSFQSSFPWKHCLLFLKVMAGIILFNFRAFRYSCFSDTAAWWHSRWA